MPYREIDHTADFGLEFRGKDIKDLFISAGQGLFDSITDIDEVRSVDRFNIAIEGTDAEDLLIEWLRELLYLHHIKKMLLKEFNIIELDEKRLLGRVSGESFDEKRHLIKKEIKAATYHDLFVKKNDDGWTARVIFDI